MSAWEYEVRYFNGKLQQELDEAGPDGWELAAVDWKKECLVLKRPAGSSG
ncbi:MULTISPECIES: hypothetical protein [unclassified Nonomuraea]